MARWEIEPRLYQGGFATESDVSGIDLIVTLAGGGIYPAPARQYLIWSIDDADRLPDQVMLRLVAEYAHRVWRSGKTVLIQCGAGVNRSGLVMARVLMYDGLLPEQAVGRIRERRGPEALSNATFVRWLSTEVPEDDRRGHG